MPFLKDFLINNSTKIILWKIIPGELCETQLSEDDKCLLKTRKHKNSKEYFLAVRKLLENEDPELTIDYDLKGKPFGMVWDSLQQNNEKWKGTDSERGWWCDSIMLIDCAKAKKWVDSIEVQANWEGTYKWHFMEKLGSPYKSKSETIVQEIDARWNSFDGSDTAFPYERP